MRRSSGRSRPRPRRPGRGSRRRTRSSCDAGAPQSKGDSRTSRCTPCSDCSHPYAWGPRISTVADFAPASSPASASRTVTSKPLALGPPQVHAQEHLGPVLGVGAAGAGMDRHDRVVVVQLAGEQRLGLERRRARACSRAMPSVTSASSSGRRASTASSFAATVSVDERARASGTARRRLRPRDSARVTSCAFSASSHRSGRPASSFGASRARSLCRDVKETPRARAAARRAPSGLAIGLPSRRSLAVASLVLLARAARTRIVASDLVAFAPDRLVDDLVVARSRRRRRRCAGLPHRCRPAPAAASRAGAAAAC